MEQKLLTLPATWVHLQFLVDSCCSNVSFLCSVLWIIVCPIVFVFGQGRRGRDRMLVGITTTYAISAYTTDVVSSNLNQGEVYNIMW